jgi:hypothetical protein
MFGKTASPGWVKGEMSKIPFLLVFIFFFSYFPFFLLIFYLSSSFYFLHRISSLPYLFTSRSPPLCASHWSPHAAPPLVAACTCYLPPPPGFPRRAPRRPWRRPMHSSLAAIEAARSELGDRRNPRGARRPAQPARSSRTGATRAELANCHGGGPPASPPSSPLGLQLPHLLPTGSLLCAAASAPTKPTCATASPWAPPGGSPGKGQSEAGKVLQLRPDRNALREWESREFG